MKRLSIFLSLLPMISACASRVAEPAGSPRIVNIINFIRYTEPRYEEMTEKVLFETVRSQAEDLRRKDLVGTYLLQ